MRMDRGDIFITDSHLHIVGRQQLIIAHVIPLYPHKCSVMICFAIAVPILAANPDMFAVAL